MLQLHDDTEKPAARKPNQDSHPAGNAERSTQEYENHCRFVGNGTVLTSDQGFRLEAVILFALRAWRMPQPSARVGTNATDADKAIAALNGTLLDERASNVNEARPKKEPGSLRPRLPGPWRKALVVPAGSILTCPMLASPHKSQFYKAGSNPASHFLPQFV